MLVIGIYTPCAGRGACSGSGHAAVVVVVKVVLIVVVMVVVVLLLRGAGTPVGMERHAGDQRHQSRGLTISKGTPDSPPPPLHPPSVFLALRYMQLANSKLNLARLLGQNLTQATGIGEERTQPSWRAETLLSSAESMNARRPRPYTADPVKGSTNIWS